MRSGEDSYKRKLSDQGVATVTHAHDGGLERLAETCVRNGWRMGIVTDDHTSPLRLAYLEVRGRRPDRELLARSPVTSESVDEACGDVEVSLQRQGLLAR